MNKNILIWIIGMILLSCSVMAYDCIGGTITTDGSYIVHTFLSNDTFNCSFNINTEILIVAGGGAGGSGIAGGGGAGGLKYNSSYDIPVGNYSIIVGLGGIANLAEANIGTNGQYSSFNNLLNSSGGGYGGDFANNANNGGSGGGGGRNTNSGTGISGEGYNGGVEATANNIAGGGGGASQVGYDGVGTVSGNGGDGLQYSINGSAVYYAGGGGGGAYVAPNTAGNGGLGGGGNGKMTDGPPADSFADSGINGTGGGGGGGSGNNGRGGNGGSGIVIIRYPFVNVLTSNLSSYSNIINYNFTVLLNITNNNETAQSCFISSTNSNFICTANYTAGNITVIPCYFNQVAEQSTVLTPYCNSSSYNITAKNRTIVFDNYAPRVSSTINNSYVTDYTNFIWNVSDYQVINWSVQDSCNLTTTFAYNGTTGFSNQAYPLNYSIINRSCSLGLQSTNLTVCDNLSQCTTVNNNWQAMGRLNITVKDASTNATLINFSVYKNGTLMGNTTSGIYILDNLSQGIYNITIDATGYQLISADVNITSVYRNYTFYPYTTNSLRIFILDEDTGILILQNTTMRFQTNTTSFNRVSTNGTYYIDNLVPDIYQIQFVSSGYSVRTYTLTVGNRSSQQLDAYLAQTTLSTIFTLYDINSPSTTIPDASCVMYKQLNGSWSAIESIYSDITGRVQFSYVASTQYKFYFSKTGYNDYIFYLNPILFATYDVKMTPSTTYNYTPDYGDVNIIWAPSTFVEGVPTTFNFIISSTGGQLTNYGYTLEYSGATASASGVNAIGEQLSSTITVTDAITYNDVVLKYYYKTSLTGDYRNFTATFPVQMNNTYTNNTIENMRNRQFGLGVFERILIATIIVIFIVGIGTLVGQPLPGFVLGLMVMGMMTYINFIPIYATMFSFIFGIIFLMIKFGGN